MLTSSVATGLRWGFSALLLFALQEPPAAGEPAQSLRGLSNALAEALYEYAERSFFDGDFDGAVAGFATSYELSCESLLLYDLALALARRYEVSGAMGDLVLARIHLHNFVSLEHPVEAEVARNVARLSHLIDRGFADEATHGDDL